MDGRVPPVYERILTFSRAHATIQVTVRTIASKANVRPLNTSILSDVPHLLAPTRVEEAPLHHGSITATGKS